MSESREERLSRIMLQALETPPPDRAAYLGRECGDDLDLRLEIEDLLNVDPRADALFPHTGTIDLGADVSSFGSSAVPGELTIEGYEIHEELGRGGMGVVFRAEQANPRRTVALKITRFECLSDSARRRFEFEVQVLGRLHHPGIAQIFEAGLAKTALGELPYFAMEYVEGASLVDYVRTNALDLRAKIRLFEPICEAVHHAHLNGVVHRDLKPGNILVDAQGQPKVLDFGIARSTDGDVSMTTGGTEGSIIGTLSYMSPEQTEGRSEAIDARSDVYALGVLLYELFTGALPYDVLDKPIPEVIGAIRSEDPKPPSRFLPALRGDVETILRKALAKERSRRYASAMDLAVDLRRYLNNEPILARPPTRRYLLKKFVRRHRTLVTLLTALLVVLLGGIAATWVAVFEMSEAREQALWEKDRADQELGRAVQARQDADLARTRAEAYADAARAVNTFFNDELLSSIDPVRALGDEPTVRDIFFAASAGIEGKFLDRPEVEAGIRHTLGSGFLALGLHDEARQHLDRAMALRGHTRDLDLAATMDRMAQLVSRIDSDYARAERLMRDCLAIRVDLLGADHLLSRKAEGRIHMFSGLGEGNYTPSLDNLAAWSVLAGMRRRGESPQVVRGLFLELVTDVELLWPEGEHDRCEQMVREFIEPIKFLEDPCYLVTSAGMELHRMGRLVAAEAAWVIAIALGREAGVRRPRTIQAIIQLALFYVDEMRIEDAQPLLREGFLLSHQVLGAESQFSIAATIITARLELEQEEFEKALRYFDQALETYPKVQGEGPSSELFHTFLPFLSRLRELDCLDEAMEYCERLHQIETEHWGPWAGVGSLLIEWGLCYRALGDGRSTEEKFLVAERLLEQGIDEKAFREGLSAIREFYLETGNLERAEAYRVKIDALEPN